MHGFDSGHDINRAVKELTEHPETNHPAAVYLKFLAQFLDRNKKLKHLPIAQQYALLWQNDDKSPLLPKELHHYQYLAHMCWLQFSSTMNYVGVPEHRLSDLEEKNDRYLISYGQWRHINEFQAYAVVPSAIANVSSSGLRTTLDRIASTSENQAMCLMQDHSKEDEKIPLSVQRDWARIGVHPTLQISSTLQWILDNLSDIRNEAVKDQIEKKLLAPNGLLMKQLQQTPQLIVRLRAVIQEGIKFFGENPKDMPQVLFFIRLGIACETHIIQAGFANSQMHMHKFETLLLKRINGEKDKHTLAALYRHLRFLYAVTLPNGQESLKEMIKAGFWLDHTLEGGLFQNEFNTPNWLLQEIHCLEDIRCEELEKCHKDPRWVNAVCRETFALLFPKMSPPKEEWKGTFPAFSCQEYTINLREGVWLRNKTEQLWCFDIYVFRSARNPDQNLPNEFRKQIEDAEYRFWIGKTGYDSYDGTYRFAANHGANCQVSVSVQRQFKTERGTCWYQKVSCTHPLVCSMAREGGEVWQNTATPGEYLITDGQSNPRYAVFQKGEVLEARPFDTKGKLLPYKLLNLEKHDPFFFKRLGLATTEVLCWIDDAGKMVSLELLPLKLTFQGELKDGHWALRCRNYPDFFLAPDQMVSALGSFKGALILENALGEKRVLIATKKPEWVHHDFTTEVVLTQQPLAHPTLPYYHYILDESSQTLRNDDPDANLFLVILLASMRDYTAALNLLDQGRSYRYISDFFENFSALHDESPEALAFYLKVGLYLFDNHSQVIHEGYGTQGSQFKDEVFYQWLSKKFRGYLRYASSENKRVPAYILLTPEEELRLLTQLQKSLEKLPHLLEVRKSILESHMVAHTQIPAYYTLSPFSFSALPLYRRDKRVSNPFDRWSGVDHSKHTGSFDPAFVRMDVTGIRHHFISLFEKAKRGEARLDLFYLARSSELEHKESADAILEYAHLLLVVNTYPEAFAKYSFGQDPARNEAIFSSIAQIAQGLQSYLPSSLTTSVFLNYTALNNLQLPPSPTLTPLAWKFQNGVGKNLTTLHLSLHSTFLEEWVTIETKPAITDQRPFIFDSLPASLKKSPLLSSLIETYKQGYTDCHDAQKNGRDQFTLKDNKQPKECLKAAKDLLEKKRDSLEVVRKKAELMANDHPPSLFLNKLKHMGQALPAIKIEGILTDALEGENPNLIRAANPSLSPDKIEELLTLTMEYHILNCHIVQLLKGIKALTEKQDIQAFGEALAVYGAFDPTTDPELLIYQSRMQLIARKEQGEFAKWLKNAPLDGELCKLLLFEFEAGGGKGTFFTPILKKLARKMGLFPISTSPGSLYQVERKKQRAALKRAYRLNMEVLEIALNTQATHEDFKWIYEKLTDYAKKSTLKIIPEVYYALELKYQLALESEDESQVATLSLILNLFEEKGAGFIDEGRMNLSPFTQAKIGIGRKMSLPSQDHQLFIHIYQALTGNDLKTNDRRLVSAVMQLSQNKQAMMSTQDREAVRVALIEHMVNRSALADPRKGAKKDRGLVERSPNDEFDVASKRETAAHRNGHSHRRSCRIFS